MTVLPDTTDQPLTISYIQLRSETEQGLFPTQITTHILQIFPNHWFTFCGAEDQARALLLSSTTLPISVICQQQTHWKCCSPTTLLPLSLLETHPLWSLAVRENTQVLVQGLLFSLWPHSKLKSMSLKYSFLFPYTLQISFKHTKLFPSFFKRSEAQQDSGAQTCSPATWETEAGGSPELWSSMAA